MTDPKPLMHDTLLSTPNPGLLLTKQGSVKLLTIVPEGVIVQYFQLGRHKVNGKYSKLYS